MSKRIVTIVDVPHVSLAENEKTGEALLKFFRALGWNGDDYLDPSKIRTTKDVYNRLYDVMYDKCPDPVGVGMLYQVAINKNVIYHYLQNQLGGNGTCVNRYQYQKAAFLNLKYSGRKVAWT